MDDDLEVLREEVAKAAQECVDRLLLDLVLKMLISDDVK